MDFHSFSKAPFFEFSGFPYIVPTIYLEVPLSVETVTVCKMATEKSDRNMNAFAVTMSELAFFNVNIRPTRAPRTEHHARAGICVRISIRVMMMGYISGTHIF